MAMRAIWKGQIRLGASTIPVKLYSAVEDRSVHFRLLHSTDHTPVQQEMIHPETGEVVAAEAMRHGFATEDGRLVILSEAELKGLEPEPSRDIEILQFLPDATIDHRWYERPYFLGPDGDRESYFALSAALESDQTEGLAHWVMRNKAYFGVLRLRLRYPLLITLRHVEEVVALTEVQIPTGRDIEPRELAMGEQLVAALADTFDPSRYRDDYRTRVRELIAAKAGGKVIALPKAPVRQPTENLEKALADSLLAIKEKAHG